MQDSGLNKTVLHQIVRDKEIWVARGNYNSLWPVSKMTLP